jgi:hypothetical protein
MSFRSIFMKIARVKGLKSAQDMIAQLAGQKTQAQIQEEQRKAQEAEKAALALKNASAITDNGRQTATTPTNNVTNQPVSVDNTESETDLYINNMRNRRRKRGAPMAQNQGVLGQPTSLGV